MNRLLIILPLFFCSAINFVAHPKSKYKKGTVFQYSMISPAGLQMLTYDEVVSDSVVNGVHVLNMKSYTRTDGQTSRITSWKYFYDNNHWAPDLGIEMLPEKVGLKGGSVAEFHDSVVYPLTMKVGDTLAMAHEYKKITLKDEYWECDRVFYNRKVMERDTLDILGSKYPAMRIEFKISSHVNRKSKTLGDKQEVDLHYCSVWFSHEFGIIQTEATDKFGVTKTTLISVK